MSVASSARAASKSPDTAVVAMSVSCSSEAVATADSYRRHSASRAPRRHQRSPRNRGSAAPAAHRPCPRRSRHCRAPAAAATRCRPASRAGGSRCGDRRWSSRAWSVSCSSVGIGGSVRGAGNRGGRGVAHRSGGMATRQVVVPGGVRFDHLAAVLPDRAGRCGAAVGDVDEADDPMRQHRGERIERGAVGEGDRSEGVAQVHCWSSDRGANKSKPGASLRLVVTVRCD